MGEIIIPFQVSKGMSEFKAVLKDNVALKKPLYLLLHIHKEMWNSLVTVPITRKNFAEFVTNHELISFEISISTYGVYISDFKKKVQ